MLTATPDEIQPPIQRYLVEVFLREGMERGPAEVQAREVAHTLVKQIFQAGTDLI